MYRGNPIPISQMDSVHLERTIDSYITKMNEKKRSVVVHDLFGDLEELSESSNEEVQKTIQLNMEYLEPYLTELVIRGDVTRIKNVSSKLKTILERNMVIK